ncbi:hypothetical protein PACTADRAFT_49995 [Pachysolen tannophilus NRRL Y-2460]|uniref:4'-phosphopantetheinyl transferase domain-containing protein n=1 Tax=Pachysolen tannophilus NRRL Y-2460 TaxID=669874 RepID=A0A1E4TU31_PACTA|nr:hypothetical protein PACTADRAFT_49995 [Pachysolen tannophilus NRRL Y-2460]
MSRIIAIGTDLVFKPRFEAILLRTLIKQKINANNSSSSNQHILRFSSRILHPLQELPIFLKYYNGIQNFIVSPSAVASQGGFTNSAMIKMLSSLNANMDNEFVRSIEQMREDTNFKHCVSLLSTSWCLKEALYKVLDPNFQKSGFNFKDWYKINDLDTGKPILIGETYTSKHANEEFLISLSHDGDYVYSVVLRQKYNL